MGDNMLVVGRIGRPHGIRGEVTVDVRTDDPDSRFAPGAVLATDPAPVGPLTIEQVRWHSGRLLLAFAGVVDRTGAEALRGTRLLVDYAEVPLPDDPDEFHDQQLIGLAVETVSGQAVGAVTEIRHTGQDLLVVGRPTGGEVYIPFVKAIVSEVDVAGGRVVINPPAGLLGES